METTLRRSVAPGHLSKSPVPPHRPRHLKSLALTLRNRVRSTSRDFGKLLSRGLVDNSNDDKLSNLIPEIMDLGTLIAQHSSRKPAIEIFAKPNLIGALLRIWLGEQPADAVLKAALLGKAV